MKVLGLGLSVCALYRWVRLMNGFIFSCVLIKIKKALQSKL
jgi:hypothetical protein